MTKIKAGLWILAGLLWLSGIEVRGQITLGTQTKGILPVNQGGTNATDAATARANIGAVGLSDSQILSNKIITSPRINDFRGYTNGLMTLLFGEAAGAVNYVGIYQAATGNGPLIQALGTDANVDLRLRPQGSGALDLGAMTAIKITGCAVGDYLRIAGGNLASCDSGSGSGAPTAASYVTRTSEAGLSNEFALDSLATGLLKNTAGTLSTAGAADLPNHASRHNDGGADEIGIDGSQVISGLVVDARIPTTLAGRTFTTGVSVDGTGTDGQNFVRIDDSSGGPQPPCVAGSAVLYSSLGQLDYCNGFTMTRQIVGNVYMASGTPGQVPYISSTGVIQGLAGFATAATPDTFALRDGQGALKARQHEAVPTTDSIAGVFQRYSSSQVNYIFEIRREDTARMAGVDKDFNWVGNVIGNVTGSAGTAGALTSNPTDCPATGFAYQINSAANLTCRAVDLTTADTTGQLAVSRLNVTGTPDNTKVLYGDRWAAPPSGGGNLGIYNVKDSPYSAVGDGTNDDTAEVQAAINACQDSTRGGIVYFPPGVYAISGELAVGNGSGGTESTKRPCMLEGAGGTGGGTSSNRQGASIIRWTGTAPGSTSYALRLNGPFIGGGIKHLTIDVNSKSNLRGVLVSTVSHGYFESVSVINYATLGMLITATTLGSHGLYGACDNYFSNLKIVWPASGGSGLALEGNDVSGGMDSCSNNFYGALLWHDNGTAGTYGLNLGFADNNRFWSLNIYGFPETSTNGSAIKFTQATNNAAFPHENTFTSVSAHQGVTGTAGSGQPNIFYDWHLGDCWHNCDPYAVGGSVKPIVFSTDRSLKGVTVPGEFVYTGTDENNKSLLINHSSGGQNGAGNLVFQRAGADMARIKGHYFDGLEFFTSNGSGGTPTSKLHLKTNGALKISNATRSAINGIGAEVGDLLICTDCSRDTACTAGGTGALAKSITSGTGIANWVCN